MCQKWPPLIECFLVKVRLRNDVFRWRRNLGGAEKEGEHERIGRRRAKL